MATYNRYNKLPEEYAKYMPSELEIVKRISNLIDENKQEVFNISNNKSLR
ncbi:MAG: hypothetical protein LBC03_00190 [Nitrososphaerota archaeon]|nr:hypothetical protein [Nitrososphaerota archaeon]